jgi:hypothetical protein
LLAIIVSSTPDELPLLPLLPLVPLVPLVPPVFVVGEIALMIGP